MANDTLVVIANQYDREADALADFEDVRTLTTVRGRGRVVERAGARRSEGNTPRPTASLVRPPPAAIGCGVLAHESGRCACWKAWQHVQPALEPESAFRRSVFRIWTES